MADIQVSSVRRNPPLQGTKFVSGGGSNDVYKMANSWVKEASFSRKELLEKDVAFKEKFYYAKTAHYETATLASIELIPANHIIEAVKTDYAAMKNMIYGEYPSFETILECLENLQEEVHQLSQR